MLNTVETMPDISCTQNNLETEAAVGVKKALHWRVARAQGLEQRQQRLAQCAERS
jgi:hypothetical protein